ncbi:hypothetical protein HYH03_008767 [Edaphochlamys debaryana]|uniref:ER membrane protein complex subunit 1 n=1 Tax=Edaphochlamys debaryana TaxID=47281 RepID=A0A836BZ86_9CHLO|nr:hypothetical protein HYH03_008767 [Edaphochlamys debaryana]|eukprot:KAG2493104.1 hypothetical protein HYH03_008767 [Edaphochlamys debaryana]
MSEARLILLVASVLAIAGGAAALFEDQAGTYDWYKQHIGVATEAAFHPSKPRVCVATQQSVVGCLNLRDGAIAWRKRADTGVAAMLMMSSPATMVTAANRTVRMFDLEGNQKWQRSLPGSSGPVLLAELPDGGDTSAKGRLAVVQGGTVQILDASDGSPVGDVQSEPVLKRDIVLVVGPALVAYDVGSKNMAVVPLIPDVQGTAAAQELGSPLPLSAFATSSPAGLAALSSDLSALCVSHLTDGVLESTLSCTQLVELVPQSSGGPWRVAATSSGFLLLSADPGAPGAVLLSEEPGTPIKLLRYFPDVVSASREVQTEAGRHVALMHVDADGRLRLMVASTSTGDVTLEESFPAVPAHGRVVGQPDPPQPIALALGAFRKKDKSTGYRALVSLDSGSLALLQQGVIVWSRDESLASVEEALFADLPAAASDSSVLEAGGAKADMNARIRYQVLGAKVQLKLNTPAEAEELLQLRGVLSDKNLAVRDVNGFRKLLLVRTSAGTVAAVHNGDGRKIWSRRYTPDTAPTHLLPWRSYHDIQHAPEVLVMRDAAPGAYATVLNAHTGEQLWHQPLPYGVGKVVPMHPPMHEGSAVQSTYILVEQLANGEAPPALHLLPDSPASRTHVLAAQRPAFLVQQAPGTSTLQGFSLAPAPGRPSGVIAQPAWQVVFPDSILALASRDPSEPIQSSVKVLSDRSIKYKYLNPNLLFVASGPATGAALDGSAGVGTLASEVTATLLDTVTGRVLHRQSHAGARGPITAVLAEHAVLYFFTDIDTGRQVACSMELYDATPGREFSVLDYLFNPNSTLPVSSFSATPIEVLTQSYYSRLVPTGAAVTRTEQGITAKQLLLLANTDQVYALDRRWVDPRRPKKQKLSQEEMEEGLVPYQDTLPFSPLSFTTLDKQVLGARSVRVEPTRLESTCLVFVHGVDLFYTRTAPAKGFDSLEDDFNYALLLAALVGLAGGAVVMQYMSKQALLGQRWK